MFTCLNRQKGSSTRRLSNVCSLETPLRGKGVGVLSLRQGWWMSPVTSCSVGDVSSCVPAMGSFKQRDGGTF